MIRENSLSKSFIHENKHVLDIYTIRLFYSHKDIVLSRKSPDPGSMDYEILYTFPFKTKEEGLIKFNDICEHIEYYVKENEND